jgi:hypothetical protein
MTDVEILKEFKKRFENSVLYDMNIGNLLEIIGLEKIKKHLKEQRGYRLVKIKDHWRHND